MTDRYVALTVILDGPTRDDDAEFIINAIRMLRGVKSVEPVIDGGGHSIAYESARLDLLSKLRVWMEETGEN